MEPNFYVVGDNKITSFFLRSFKFIIILLILIIIGLSATIAYLKYIHIKDLEILNEHLERVKSRSTSLVEKLRETGQRDSKWEQQVLSQSSKQKTLNEQQASLIEKQAEDGIRDVERSRGLGDVYKRQNWYCGKYWKPNIQACCRAGHYCLLTVSYTHLTLPTKA